MAPAPLPSPTDGEPRGEGEALEAEGRHRVKHADGRAEHVEAEDYGAEEFGDGRDLMVVWW